VLIGLFTLTRVVALWLARSEEITSTQRTVHDNLMNGVLLFLMLGVPILFRIFPVGYALLPSGPTVARVLLNSAIAGAVGVVGLAVALRGHRPFRASRPMVRGELWRRNRTVVGAWAGLILVLAVTGEFGIVYTEAVTVVLFGSLLFAYLGILLSGFVSLPSYGPYMRFGIRRPTDAERDRIEGIYDGLDIPRPDSIEITVADDHERVVVLRNGDGRVLALSDSVLSSFDGPALSVGIAHAEGRSIHGMSRPEKGWMASVVVSAALLLWTFIFVTLGAETTASAAVGALSLSVGLLLFVAPLMGSMGRKRVRLVDEYTVEHAGKSAVADVYGRERRFGFIQTRKTTGRSLFDERAEKLFPEPVIESRLAYLGLTDGESSRQQTPGSA